MGTVLTPPITKRFTKDSIGYVQSGRHGLETIIFLSMHDRLMEKFPKPTGA